MFKARICGWIGLLPLFMLSLPVQAELRCVANVVDIEQFFLRLPLKINNKLNKLSTVA
ncbi:protein involved in detoxification of methylglyoxal [Escherichia coli]|nr:protein involved in detoxification of methylglyoxal [Escherichia coli]